MFRIVEMIGLSVLAPSRGLAIRNAIVLGCTEPIEHRMDDDFSQLSRW